MAKLKFMSQSFNYKSSTINVYLDECTMLCPRDIKEIHRKCKSQSQSRDWNPSALIPVL